MKPIRVYFPVMLAVLLFLATASQAADLKPAASNAGGVRVDVVPVQLAAGQQARFQVSLNTHSVPLDQDLTAVSVLRDSRGREYKPVHWDGAPPGGHHRKGILVFPELSAPLNSVTLTIHDIAGIANRDFAWQLNQ